MPTMTIEQRLQHLEKNLAAWKFAAVALAAALLLGIAIAAIRENRSR